MFAVREIDALVHARANDRFAQLLVISIAKRMTSKLTFDFVTDGDEKRRNIIPKEVDELIIGNNDQDVGLGLLQILAQHPESSLGIPPQFFLLLESRPARGALGRHTVVQIHEIFPFTARLEKYVRRVACGHGRN